MKTDRRPVYDGFTYRIASMGNDLWQLQKRVSDSPGRHAAWTRRQGGGWTQTAQHFDPWQGLAKPTLWAVALDQLKRARSFDA